ncbi:MAG: DUF134 domain-containing protein [Patescibacteria group bacterium]
MRPRKFRHVCTNPEIKFFKPQGVPMSQLEIIDLTDEELEALRLKNIEDLDQIIAAEKMGTSQSTFQRILTSAYKKISDALVNGKAIKITEIDRPMKKFECWKCKHIWEEPFGNGKRGIDMNCPECQSEEIHRCDNNGHGFGNQIWGHKGNKE